MSILESATLGEGELVSLPEPPPVPYIVLWALGIALAFFTVALLILFAALSHPHRMVDTWLMVMIALAVDIIAGSRLRAGVCRAIQR